MPDIYWDGDSATADLASRLDETSGNLILVEDRNGGVALLEWDGTAFQYRGPVDMNGEDISNAGAISAASASVSGAVDAGSVSTEEATIGGQISDLHWQEVNDKEENLDADESLVVDVENVSNYDDYLLFYSVDPRNNDGGVGLRINEDDGSEYGYWDEEGVKNISENEFLILSSTSGAAASAQGWVFLPSGEQDDLGIQHEIAPQRFGQINGFGLYGFYDVTRTVNTAEFFPIGSGGELSGINVHVFGRDR